MTTPALRSKIDILFDRFQKDIVLHGKRPVTIANAMKQNESDGLSVVLVHGGLGTVHRVWGEMRAVEGMRTTKSTIYQAASTTKMVTGLGFAGAHRRGDINIDESLTRFCSRFPDSLVGRWIDKKFNKKELPWLDHITIRRLLSHSAGLDTHGIGTTDEDRKGETMELILLGHLLDPVHNGVNPQGPPGYTYSYSGGGYTVAEAMLEIETRTTFADYMTRHVLVPFGMSRSTFATAGHGMANLAWGCNKKNCREPELTRVKAAGGLLAHPEDYAHLLFLMGNDGEDREGRQVIPQEDVRAVLTPAFHRMSSNRACAGGDCPLTTLLLLPGVPPLPVVETCFQGRCRLPLDAEGWWYGLGTKLRKSLSGDGYPRELVHGGAQDGFSAGFIFNRDAKVGIVAMVNGKETFKKDGEEWGSHTLRRAIEDAFRREFDL